MSYVSNKKRRRRCVKPLSTCPLASTFNQKVSRYKKVVNLFSEADTGIFPTIFTT